ncbi:hypothetical protein IPG41_07030 [Candidatus Peregrinibacteria bacterium]|nr:MAG: hypothetical protein IPG41_07030 [Candidatus Peregrinibacteria bacterium]
MSLLEQFIQTPAPFFTLNGDGLPMGEAGNYRKKIPDEDFTKKHDPLVPIKDELLTRPMYFNLKMTEEECMHFRVPALAHCIKFDRALQKLVAWKIRVCDAYRPMEVQRQGFCWGMRELLTRSGEGAYERFLILLQEAVTCGVDNEDRQFLEDYITLGEQFFSYVEAQALPTTKLPESATPLIIHAAGNFQLEGFELDPFAINEHNSGGIADIEFIDQKTDKVVNMGVAVDTPGYCSIFAYFEDEPAPIFKHVPRFPKQLYKLEARKAYYKKELAENVYIRNHLIAAGRDPDLAIKDAKVFKKLWEEIRTHRRIFSHLAFSMGIVVEAAEAWHLRFNDEAGGVRYKRTGEVSGAGSYATHLGKTHCAWGSANPIYHS